MSSKVISFRLTDSELEKVIPITKNANKSIHSWVKELVIKSSNLDEGISENTLSDADFFRIRELISDELKISKPNSLEVFSEKMKLDVTPGDAAPEETIDEKLKDDSYWYEHEEAITLQENYHEQVKKNQSLESEMVSMREMLDDCFNQIDYPLVKTIILVDDGDEDIFSTHLEKYNKLLSKAENDIRFEKMDESKLIRNIFLNGLDRTELNDSFWFNADTIFREHE